MPGMMGMGSMGGGLLNGLMGGMRGGMGGGMRGMNGGGQSSNTSAEQSFSDIYDVDRWKRADNMDQTTTTVQAVRNSWEQRAAEKREHSILGRIKARLRKIFHREKATPKKTAAPVPEARPVGGTIQASDMRKPSNRINSGASAAAQPAPPPEAQPVFTRPNNPQQPRGALTAEFFTANPINSTILAVDHLSFGSLTLNQVSTHRIDYQQLFAPPAENPQAPNSEQSSATAYMDAFREGREMRKYNVRIVD